MGKHITMDDILKAHLMNPLAPKEEYDSEIKARFRKTVQTRQYESEVVEGEITLCVPVGLNGAERLFIQTALEAQLEYEVFIGMYLKGQVTEDEFNTRKAALEQQLNIVKDKAEVVLNKSIDYLLE